MTEEVKLLLVVFLPLTIPIFIVVSYFGKGSWRGERWKSALTMHPEKGLILQRYLWLSIIIPVCYFFIIGGFIAWVGHNISLTAEGLAIFIRISSLPLAILSLSLPLAALVSRFHQTEQTAIQLLLTSHKNNLDSFYSHRKELFNYFEKIGEVNYLGCIEAKYKIHPRVHKNFFNGTPDYGLPEINIDAFKDIERELSSARFEIDSVIRDVNPDLNFSFYLNGCSTIYRLSYKLGLPELYLTLAEKSLLVPVFVNGEGIQNVLTVGTTTDELVAAYRYASSFFQNLCDFSGYQPENVTDDQYQYLATGGKHKTLKTPLVVERLHEIEIKKHIEVKKHNQQMHESNS